MIKTEILIIYTALILIAALMPLNYMIRNTIIKKYNEYIKISDYKNALDLLENIKFGLSKWEQKLLLINLYFTTNNYEKYKYTKHNYRLIKNDKFPDLELRQIYNIKIIDIIFMYLHEEIEKANNAFLQLLKEDNEIDKKLYYIDTGLCLLFQLLRMMNAFYSNEYAEAKKIHEQISIFAYGKTVKTLISYYMCRIYEIEGNMNAVNFIVSNIDIANNSYGEYFKKWIKI